MNKAPIKSRNIQSKDTESRLKLEKVIGISGRSNKGVQINPVTGDVAYIAGSIIVIYNPKQNKQIKFFFNKRNRPFSCLTISSNGRYIAAGEGACKQPEISIWECQYSELDPIKVFQGHRYGISALKFSPDSKHLVSLGDSNDLGLFIWDFSQGKRITSNKLNRPINDLTFTSDGDQLVTVGKSIVKFWPMQKVKRILESNAVDKKGNILEGQIAELGRMKDKNYISVSSNSTSVFTLTSDGNLCVFNKEQQIEKWMYVKVTTAHACFANETYVFAACSDGIIRCFEPKSLDHIVTLPRPPPLGAADIMAGEKKEFANLEKSMFADTLTICYDPTHSKAVTLYSDMTLFIWDLRKLQKITVYRSFLFHAGPIHDIQIVPNSEAGLSRFVTCSTDRTIRFWHYMEGDFRDPEKKLPRNAYSKDLTKLLYVGRDFSHLKGEKAGEPIRRDVTDPENQIRCIKCSPDGKHIAAGDQAGNIKIYDLSGYELLHHFEAHNNEVLCLDYSPSTHEGGCFLASGSRDRLMHLFDVQKSYEHFRTLDDHSSSVTSLKFAHSGEKLRLLSCGADKTFIFRYVTEDQVTSYHQEIDKRYKMYSLDLTPKETFAVTGQEKKITVWKVSTGRAHRIYEMKSDEKKISLDNIQVCLDSSGSYFASSSTDRYVRLRDYQSGKVIARVGSGELTTSMCFTPNNMHLVTASSDGCIFVWGLPNDMTSTMNSRLQELGVFLDKMISQSDPSRDNSLNDPTSFLNEFMTPENNKKKALEQQEEMIKGQKEQLLEILDQAPDSKAQVGPKKSSKGPSWAQTKKLSQEAVEEKEAPRKLSNSEREHPEDPVIKGSKWGKGVPQIKQLHDTDASNIAAGTKIEIASLADSDPLTGEATTPTQRIDSDIDVIIQSDESADELETNANDDESVKDDTIFEPVDDDDDSNELFEEDTSPYDNAIEDVDRAKEVQSRRIAKSNQRFINQNYKNLDQADAPSNRASALRQSFSNSFLKKRQETTPTKEYQSGAASSTPRSNVKTDLSHVPKVAGGTPKSTKTEPTSDLLKQFEKGNDDEMEETKSKGDQKRGGLVAEKGKTDIKNPFGGDFRLSQHVNQMQAIFNKVEKVQEAVKVRRTNTGDEENEQSLTSAKDSLKGDKAKVVEKDLKVEKVEDDDYGDEVFEEVDEEFEESQATVASPKRKAKEEENKQIQVEKTEKSTTPVKVNDLKSKEEESKINLTPSPINKQGQKEEHKQEADSEVEERIQTGATTTTVDDSEIDDSVFNISTSTAVTLHAGGPTIDMADLLLHKEIDPASIKIDQGKKKGAMTEATSSFKPLREASTGERKRIQSDFKFVCNHLENLESTLKKYDAPSIQKLVQEDKRVFNDLQRQFTSLGQLLGTAKEISKPADEEEVKKIEPKPKEDDSGFVRKSDLESILDKFSKKIIQELKEK
eukprot:CAMPEP_0115043006 /NCGR_PEP_ID=MMETSP0216-20121206/46605_1 /TAXON_ID=223996 /ORGANISM="Protocruzia adherens, Strain Boccale" /LENGTH=1428 /DNA_ID=CAMNT_0002425231 /DNA_START=108 /DNA_END=4394 /DNA_ORIENTATION=+